MTVRIQVMLRVVAVAVALAGCRPAVPAVPGQGGPSWIELTSPHFTLWTDASTARGRAALASMERLRVLLVHAMFPTAPDEARYLAIMLRDDAELRVFSRTGQNRAFAIPATFPLWQPLIVLSASEESTQLDVTLAHELVHAISYGIVHHQPRWFAEGMASYFQTAGLDPRLGIMEIGGSPFGGRIDVAGLLPIAELFQWTASRKDEGRQYRTAWALYWFLFNEHRDELQRFGLLLDGAGAAVDRDPDLVKRLWDQAFATLPFAAIDRALDTWIFHATTVTLMRFRLHVAERSVTERPLGDSDVHAIRAVLRHLARRGDAEVRADVVAALAAEPSHVLARLLAAGRDKARITADEVHAITAAHEADWRAWLLAAMTPTTDREQVEAARAKACELAAGNPALSPPPELCAARAAPPLR